MDAEEKGTVPGEKREDEKPEYEDDAVTKLEKKKCGLNDSESNRGK